MDKKRNEKNMLDIWRKIKRTGHFKRQKSQQVKNFFKNPSVSKTELNFEDEQPIFISISPVETSTNLRNFPPPFVVPQETPPENRDLNTENLEFDYESEEEQCELQFDKDTFQSELVCWAIKNEVNNVQFKGLLDIWNKNVPLPKLPTDPRTLLRTPRMVKIFEDPENENEKYWYGVHKNLMKILSSVKNVPSQIHVNMSIDGLPISDSSTEAFWPVLLNIHELPKIQPFIATIYHGKRKYSFKTMLIYVFVTNIPYSHHKITDKPSNLNLFLGEAIDDLNKCLMNGLDVKGILVFVKFRALIADSPARCLAKSMVI